MESSFAQQDAISGVIDIEFVFKDTSKVFASIFQNKTLVLRHTDKKDVIFKINLNVNPVKMFTSQQNHRFFVLDDQGSINYLDINLNIEKNNSGQDVNLMEYEVISFFLNKTDKIEQ